MKIFVLNAVLMLFTLTGIAQTVVFSENFDAGPSWTLNVPGGGTNGGNPNSWQIDGVDPFSAPNSLHICDYLSFCGLLGQAAYLSDPGSETDRIAYHNANIDMSIYPSSDITMTFMWMANGESNVDYGLVGYSTNGGASFTWFTTKYQLTSFFTLKTLTITSAEHLGSSTFRVGFRWINNGNSAGADPSFNVDDIELSVPSVALPPVANFAASNTVICQGTCINFSDSSSNSPTSWAWLFPGGTPATSSVQNPTGICYNTPGSYNVTLTATNANGSDDSTKTGYITVDTAATATAGPDTNICDTASYTITGAAIGGSATGLTWTTSGSGTFNDSSLVNATYTPSPADTAAGCVTLTITTNNPAGPCTAASDNMALCFYSCAAPVANFTASDTTICDSTCINFTDLSTNNPTGWSWSFTGGTPPASTDQNPTGICYNTAGAYDVTLIASNAYGSSVIFTKTFYISVDPCIPPVAGFSASDTVICETACINFTDLSTNSPTGWSWSFPGAATAASLNQNPSGICYNSAGTYDVTLIAANTYGSNLITKTDYITVNTCAGLDANFSSSDTTICDSACINFTDLSINATGWSWYFPGGTPSTSTAQNPTGICFNTSGAYTISLVVTDTAGAQDSIAKTNFIIVNSCLPPIADFTASDTTICKNTCTNFTDLSANAPTSWSWSFQGSSTATSPAQNPTGICFGTTGTYTISLVATNAYGQDSIAKINYIVVDSCTAPVADFTANDTAICTGDTVNFTPLSPGATSWAWLFSGGQPSTDSTSGPSVVYNAEGTYDVKLTVSNLNGWDDTTFTGYITVTICTPPVAGFAADTTTICEGACINFTDLSTNSPTSWRWSFPGGSPSSDTVRNPEGICYTAPGTYEVSLIAANAFGPDTLIQASYIIVKPLPAVNASYDITIAPGGSASLTAGGAGSYSWSPDAGLSSDTGAAVTASPASTTTYIVTGTTNDCPAKDSVTVYVEAVFVPNVFSPNGTGPLDNKVLKVYGSGIRSIEFRIYDRWGELVYETNSVNQAMDVGWNGRFNDEPLNPATFVYTLKVIFNNGNEYSENGNIALIR